MKTFLAAVAATLTLASPAAAQQTHLLVVSGLGGDPEYTTRFHEWATTLINAARTTYGVAEEHVTYLAESTDLDPALIDGRSTKEAVAAAFVAIADRAQPTDQVMIVLFGHGSSPSLDEARISLPGPDLSATDFATMLAGFPSQQVTFVNTASASGGFVAALSGARRTIITATKTGGERNETIFGGFFVEAFADGADEADETKDGRVSMLEAFNYARRRVAATYENKGTMLTEHAVLDDNGDATGVTEPDPAGPVNDDGAVARALFIRGGEARAARPVSDNPELQALYAETQALEERIDELKLIRGGTDPAQYEKELETLLVDMALKSRRIRELEAAEQDAAPEPTPGAEPEPR